MSAAAGAGLSTHIWNNNIRSTVMVAIYPFVLVAIVWGIAFIIGFALGLPYNDSQINYGAARYTGTSLANNVVVEYWPLVFGIAGIWLIIAYFLQTRMIRMLSHAHTVTRSEEPKLYNMVENLCISRGLKTPRIEIIETEALNAFASGIDDNSYTVTVTRGLMNHLQDDELEAVLAHELTHIMNGDVRLLIISIIFTGMVSFIAQLVWHSIRYNIIYGGSSVRGGGRKDGRIILVLLAIAAIVGIAYLATILTRFAISRKREFMADAGAVEMTRNPDAMMRALMRISGRDKIKEVSSDIAMMCTVNSSRFLGLFATHPPIEKRIEAISEVTGVNIPQDEDLQRNTNPWK